jgi:cytidine deaminase
LRRTHTRRTRTTSSGPRCSRATGAYSQGLGICAERSAIAKAASEGLKPGDVEAIAITASPCGGCRQWLHEWRFDRVWFRRADGSFAEYAADDLLPDTWDLPEG